MPGVIAPVYRFSPHALERGERPPAHQVYPARPGALVPDCLLPATRPALRITRATPIASIGSCFAREIKTWLLANGYTFVQTATGPGTEAGSARYDRVYTTWQLRQEFERAFGDWHPVTGCWPVEVDGVTHLCDPFRVGVAWPDEAAMRAELAAHAAAVRRAFTEAAVLIVTVGQNEVWLDGIDGSAFPVRPPARVFTPGRHRFHVTTYEENVANLARVAALFFAANPTGHLLVTVSPIPLRRTFRDQPAVMANAAQKAVLRAAVETLVGAHPERATYFPAYELVTTVERQPWKADNRHVEPATVERIMALFEAWFVERESR